MSRFLDALRDRVVLGDGAMGTELLARGAAKGRNLSLLNLENPDLVLQVHREYVASGAELIRTNTFTANGLRMPPGVVRQANAKGVLLAREAAGSDRFVVGSIGPLHDQGAPPDEKIAALEEQCLALAAAGCDALAFETFMEPSELLASVAAAKGLGLPIIAMMAWPAAHQSFSALVCEGAAVVGVNCVSPAVAPAKASPAGSSRALANLHFPGKRELGTPLAAFPSAGEPGSYLTADEFAGQMGPILDQGVRLVGGCCGTTPAHIHALGAKLAERAR